MEPGWETRFFSEWVLEAGGESASLVSITV